MADETDDATQLGDVEVVLARVRRRAYEGNYCGDPFTTLDDVRWTLSYVDLLRTELEVVRSQLEVIQSALGADPGLFDVGDERNADDG